MSLFLCLSVISLRSYYRKSVVKVGGQGGWEKDKKGEMALGGLSIERRVQTFCTLLVA